MADDFDLTGVLRAANEHMQAMYNGNPAACFRYLKTLLDTNDVVVGVYQESNGVGLHMIKGRHALGVIFASGEAKNLSFSAIPCTCWQQAIAVELTLGDGACRTMQPDRRATLRTVTNAFAASADSSAESLGASYRWRCPAREPCRPDRLSSAQQQYRRDRRSSEDVQRYRDG
jgi:hypothetical protein